MNRKHKILSLSLLGAAAATAAVFTAAVPTASATIVAVLPDIVLSTPTSVVLNQTESDTDIIGFDERQCFWLSANLTTDNGVIPAAPYNRVSSHFFHLDPETGGPVLNGKASFDGMILGVISSTALLDASDAECGLAGVTYPTGTETYRGLEPFQPHDRYQIVQGGTGIHIEMDVPAYSDQVRVITCCPGYNCDT